jgi:hypothetical protein
MFKGEYDGISKIVRDRMNDPNYFNSRLKILAEQIRQNIDKHEASRPKEQEEDLEQEQSLEKTR